MHAEASGRPWPPKRPPRGPGGLAEAAGLVHVRRVSATPGASELLPPPRGARGAEGGAGGGQRPPCAPVPCTLAGGQRPPCATGVPPLRAAPPPPKLPTLRPSCPPARPSCARVVGSYPNLHPNPRDLHALGLWALEAPLDSSGCEPPPPRRLSSLGDLSSLGSSCTLYPRLGARAVSPLSLIWRRGRYWHTYWHTYYGAAEAEGCCAAGLWPSARVE